MGILGQLHFKGINNELKCQTILWKHPVMQMSLKGERNNTENLSLVFPREVHQNL